MNIILLERVPKLGQIGDMVTVKSGYARNYLLPKGKAVFASKDNIQMFENKKAQLEGENITRKKEAENLAKTLKLKEIVIIRAASESGQLYGSVSAKDIAQEVTNAGLSIDKSQVILNKTLKTLSFENVSVRLHPEVFIELKLNIARSFEEAKEQSKSGKAIITTEIIGGDLRSERAQKDAKRFEKKNNIKEFEKEEEKVKESAKSAVQKDKKENKKENKLVIEENKED